MRNRSLTFGKLHFGYYLIAICGVLLITAFSYGIDILTNSISEQKKASDTYITTQRLIQSCIDSETGLRGYLLNNNVEFLEPYQKAHVEFNKLLSTALTTVDKGSDGEKRILSIKDKYYKWSKKAELSLSKPNKNQRSEETIGIERKELMDGIRKDAEEIEIAESRKMNEIYKITKVRKTFASWLVLFSSFGVVIVCLGLSSLLIRRGQELDIIHERYQLIQDASQAALWDLDVVANKVYFSPKWKSMLGYTDSEITNNITSWEALIHPDERADAMKIFSDYLEGKIPLYELEVRMKHKDGSYHVILTQGAALRTNDGKAYRVAGSHIDISDRKIREAYIALLAKEEEAIKLIEEIKKPRAPRKPRTVRTSTPSTPKKRGRPKTS